MKAADGVRPAGMLQGGISHRLDAAEGDRPVR